MPRQRSRSTAPEVRDRNTRDILGRPGLAGMVRTGGGRGGGRGRVASAIQQPFPDPENAGAAQLLCLAATAASVAPDGDHVVFDTVTAQHGFEGVPAPSGDAWVHPIDAGYIIHYSHEWDSFAGGGTIEVELDGSVATERLLVSGSAGRRVSGSLPYIAAAGQVGRIKVTHDDTDSQICDAILWVSMPDPTEVGDAPTVELLVDGEVVATSRQPISPSFSTATLLMGDGAGFPAAASSFFYDVASVMQDGSELVGNTSFESALASFGTDKTESLGNWRAYSATVATVQRQSATVLSGSYAGQVDVLNVDDGGGYLLQDVTLDDGEPFELSVYVRPTSGTQQIQIIVDWDRSTGGSAVAQIDVSPSATTFSAFGATGSGPPLPFGEWSYVTLRVTP